MRLTSRRVGWLLGDEAFEGPRQRRVLLGRTGHRRDDGKPDRFPDATTGDVQAALQRDLSRTRHTSRYPHAGTAPVESSKHTGRSRPDTYTRLGSTSRRAAGAHWTHRIAKRDLPEKERQNEADEHQGNGPPEDRLDGDLQRRDHATRDDRWGARGMAAGLLRSWSTCKPTSANA